MNDYVTKKDFDEFKVEIKEEFRRHTGILIEEFQKSINFVIEGQDVLTQRVDKLDSKVTTLGAKVDKLDTRLTRVEVKVDKLETKVDKLDTRLTRVEVKVDNLETKVDKISDELLSHRNNTELHAPIMKQKGKKQA